VQELSQGFGSFLGAGGGDGGVVGGVTLGWGGGAGVYPLYAWSVPGGGEGMGLLLMAHLRLLIANTDMKTTPAKNSAPARALRLEVSRLARPPTLS